MPTLDALMNWSIISQTQSSTHKIPPSVIRKTPQYIRRTLDDSFGLSEDVQYTKIVGCILTALMIQEKQGPFSPVLLLYPKKKKSTNQSFLLQLRREIQVLYAVFMHRSYSLGNWLSPLLE